MEAATRLGQHLRALLREHLVKLGRSHLVRLAGLYAGKPVPYPSEPWRPLRPSEQRIDLAATHAAFEDSASEAGQALGHIATAIVGDVKAKVSRLLMLGLTPQGVRDLRATTPMPVLARLAAPLLSAYRRGVRAGHADLAKHKQMRHGAATTLTAIVGRLSAAETPIKLADSFSDVSAQTFFQNKAFWITGVLENDILARAQAVLFNALKAHDKPDRVVLLELDDVLHDYLPDLDAAGRIVNVPARLENIARTNTAEAVNEGRWAMFTDPESAAFVDALEYSPILDSRTRDNHRAWDGVVKPVDWWQGPPDRRPPNGFQCRCILVPIVAGDDTPITPDSDMPDVEVVDAGFK